jgi:hypothetical protein
MEMVKCKFLDTLVSKSMQHVAKKCALTVFPAHFVV